MSSTVVIAIIVVVVLLVVGAYLGWRRRQRRKLDERRRLAAQHRDMASMSHFEAEREAARESERAARLRRDKLAARDPQPDDGVNGDSTV
jgi:predicted negative regulator of RcsB-dependent stress response